MRKALYFLTSSCFLSVFAFPKQVTLTNVFYSQSHESCSDQSLIDITAFKGTYYHKESSMVFTMSGKSFTEERIKITLLFTAYGKTIVNETYDPCVLGIADLCPLSLIPYFLAHGTLPISSKQNNLPEVMFDIPDFEGNAYFYFYSAVEEKELACLKTTIISKRSFHNDMIKWISLCFFGLSIVSSFIAFSSQSSFSYALLAASHSIPGMLTFWNYFQFLTSITLENVIYPTPLIAWASNFSFSLGLIKFFQKLIYLFHKFTENYVHISLRNFKREDLNRNLVSSNIYQGIQGQLNYLKIANTDVFITSIICFFAAIVAFFIVSLVASFFVRIIRRNEMFIRKNWINFSLWLDSC